MMNLQKEFTLRTPTPFYGRDDVYELPDFLTALGIQFLTRGITDDNTKIAFLGQNLAGPAARRFVEMGKTDRLDEMSYEEFTTKFINGYKTIQDPYSLVLKIRSIKQTGDIQRYNDLFRRHTDMLPDGIWTERGKVIEYCFGLQSDIRRNVRLTDPKTLYDAMLAAVRAEDTDGYPFVTNAGKDTSYPPRRTQDPDAMEVVELRINRQRRVGNRDRGYSKYETQFSKETFRKKKDRQYCIENKLCFKCQKPGHTSRECRSKMASSY